MPLYAILSLVREFDSHGEIPLHLLNKLFISLDESGVPLVDEVHQNTLVKSIIQINDVYLVGCIELLLMIKLIVDNSHFQLDPSYPACRVQCRTISTTLFITSVWMSVYGW